jgi:hypothetical protein
MKQFSAGKFAEREHTKCYGTWEIATVKDMLINLSLVIVLILSLLTEDSHYQNIPLEGLALHILLFCHHENYHPVGRVSCFF